MAAAYAGFCEIMESILGTPENTNAGASAPVSSFNKVSQDAKGEAIVLTPYIFDLHFDGDGTNRKRRTK